MRGRKSIIAGRLAENSNFLKEEKEMFKRRLFLSLILIAIPASADVLQVAVSGTFDNLAPTTDLSSPGASWELTFDVDSQPSTGSPGPFAFVTTGSNLEYDLNGSAVPDLSFAAVNPVQFDTSFTNGGVYVSLQGFESTADFSFGAQQLFSGSTSAPEIYTGPFPVTSSSLTGQGLIGDVEVSPNATSIVITDLSATPEPSTNLLLGTGLAGTAFLLKRRRRFAAPREGSRS
jgi:hypothetical protein